MAGSLVWGLSQKSMLPLLVPADCGTIHLRTSCTTHQADGAGRAGCHSHCGREHPARPAIRGRACPCTSSEAAEVLTRGELTRLQAATSAALATDNQTSLPFGKGVTHAED